MKKRIKRIISIFIVLVMCFAMCACESSGKSSESKKEKKSSSSSKDNKDKDNKDSDDKEDASGLLDLLKGKKDDNAPDSGKTDSTPDDRSDKDVQDDNSGSSGAGLDDGGDPDDDIDVSGPRTDDSVDLSGLSAKHGKAYVYVHTQDGYFYDGEWTYSDVSGYVTDGDMKMQRTLTVYRYSNHSDIEYMLSSKGDWDEFWHVEYNYPAKCVFFDNVEGGTVTISGNQAIWDSDYGEYREIYTLYSTREFDN